MTEHTTDIPSPNRLRRSRSDRMLAGVCGGLAAYFELHPAVFRVAFVVLTLLGGAGILIYLAAALVMPDEGKEDSIASAALRARRDHPWRLIALGVVAIAATIVLSEVSLWRGDAWMFLLVAGAVILWITRYGVGGERATDAPVPPAEGSRRPRRLLRRLGIAVASIAAALLVLAAVFTAVFDVHLRRGVGERSHVVATVDDLRSEYRLGIGDLRVDLRAVLLPAGETHVEARVDVGELRLLVPGGIALRVRADARLGQVDVLGNRVEGGNVEARLDETGTRVLVLDAHVGLGDLRVTRAVP